MISIEEGRYPGGGGNGFELGDLKASASDRGEEFTNSLGPCPKKPCCFGQDGPRGKKLAFLEALCLLDALGVLRVPVVEKSDDWARIEEDDLVNHAQSLPCALGSC